MFPIVSDDSPLQQRPEEGVPLIHHDRLPLPLEVIVAGLHCLLIPVSSSMLSSIQVEKFLQMTLQEVNLYIVNDQLYKS